MSERNASSQRDQNQDRSSVLDYSGLRPRQQPSYPQLPPSKLQRCAGKLSLYAAIIQIFWAVASVPFLLFAWKMPPSELWLWLCFIAWPSVVALVFGVYSLRVSGFNRTNVPGVIGLIFSGIVVLVMVTLFVLGP
jgi:hypothetical protein